MIRTHCNVRYFWHQHQLSNFEAPLSTEHAAYCEPVCKYFGAVVVSRRLPCEMRGTTVGETAVELRAVEGKYLILTHVWVE